MGNWGKLLILCTAIGLPGCSYGWTHNPVSFPHIPLYGDVVRTHSKPAGPAYFKNYDRDSARMEVVIQSPLATVGSRQLVLVSILDEKGKPLSRRCVEWTLEGAGSILEVDESGLKPGRGYKVDSRFAVSYTDMFSHTLSKYNGRPEEDIPLKPGQSWCVISSMTEGDSHLSIWAPEIANHDENRRVVTIRWVDAEWTLPPVQCATRTSQPMLSTLLRRRTDRAPISGYRVRYTILDGAPAGFVTAPGAPPVGPEVVATSDERGLANVAVVPMGGRGGRTRIGIKIIRPADPSTPSGTVVVIGEGETAIDWEAPALSLEQVAPASIGVNQDMTVSLLVVNKGNVASGPIVVRAPIPEGTQHRSSEPAAKVEGNFLVWSLPSVPARGELGLRTVLRCQRVGPITTLASMQGGEGIKDERTATVQVLPPEEPKLAIEITGPREATLNGGNGGVVAGNPLPLEVIIRNVGTGVARDFLLAAEFDPLLEHESKRPRLETDLEPLAPGQSRSLPLPLRPIKVGAAKVRVAALKDKKPAAAAEYEIVIREPGVGLKILGPQTAFLGAPATWEIEAINQGTVPVQNLVVQGRLPTGFVPISASDNGQPNGRELTWTLGPLAAGARRRVKVTAVTRQPAEKTELEARIVGRPGGAQLVSTRGQTMEVYTSSAISVRGLPSLRLQVRDSVDPIEIGGATTYRIDVTNDGTMPVSKVQVTASLPNQMQFVGARGPTDHQQEGASLSFAPINQLQPGQTVTYLVDMTAVVAGDARLRVQLLGGSAKEPLLREESTNIR